MNPRRRPPVKENGIPRRDGGRCAQTVIPRGAVPYWAIWLTLVHPGIKVVRLLVSIRRIDVNRESRHAVADCLGGRLGRVSLLA